MEAEPEIDSRKRQITELKGRVMEMLQKATPLSGESEPLLYNLGTLLLQQEQEQGKEEARVVPPSSAETRSEALGYFELAASMNPSRDASWFNIAIIREASADFEGSLSAYTQALAVTKDAKTAMACFNNQIGMLLAQNRVDEAARVADAAVNAYPDDPSTWTSMGVVLRVNGNDDLAITCFKNALSRGADEINIVAINNLGMLYSKQGLRSHAVAMLKRVLVVTPDDLGTLKALIPILADLGKPEEATECLRRAITLDPQDTQLSFQLSMLENTWPFATNVVEGSTSAGTSSSVQQQPSLNFPEPASSILAPAVPLPLASMPREYVVDLFDFYAQNGYDQHMVDLQYKGPQLLWELFSALEQRGKGVLSAYKTIELGVGSGLCGNHFRQMGVGGDIIGCDLSPVMAQSAARCEVILDHAHELVYRSVVVSDANDFLEAHGRSDSDLILAADVLCYMGDLLALFKKARFALKDQGLFLFSVEELETYDGLEIGAGGDGGQSDGVGSGDGEGEKSKGESVGPQAGLGQVVQGGLRCKAPIVEYALQSSGRFAHSEAYLQRLAARAGFDVAIVKRGAVRLDGNRPVSGLVVALRATSPP